MGQEEITFEEVIKSLLAVGQQFKPLEELMSSLYVMAMTLQNQSILADVYKKSYDEALKIQKELETGKLTIPKSSRETKNLVIKQMRRIRNQADEKMKNLGTQGP